MGNIERSKVGVVRYSTFSDRWCFEQTPDEWPRDGTRIEVAPAERLRGAVDLEAATERVMALMVRSYGAARSDETREQAQRLARAALGGQ